MQYSIQPILNRLQNISDLLNQIHFGGMKNVQHSLSLAIQSMNEQMANLSINVADVKSVDQIRDQLVQFRVTLRPYFEQIEETQSKFAEFYRQEIGEQKDQFESLSEIMQQQFNPRAYANKHTFKQLERLLDSLSELNATIMDLGSSLEQGQLAHTSPPNPAGSAQGDDVRYNNDPARPTLS